MGNIDVERRQVQEAYLLAKKLTRSDIPVIRTLAVHVLGTTRLMLSEICPDKFEHVSEHESAI